MTIAEDGCHETIRDELCSSAIQVNAVERKMQPTLSGLAINLLVTPQRERIQRNTDHTAREIV